jgi:hypothetical protein
MIPCFTSVRPTRSSGRRSRDRQPELGVEQLDKRQMLSASRAAAPTVDVPAAFSVEQRQATRLDFGETPFADIDSPGSKRMTVTVRASAGTLSASSGAGVRVTGKGATRVFSGSLDSLNDYFSAAGQISYRNNAEGAYSLSVRIAEKVGRRTLASTGRGVISVTAAAAAVGTVPAPGPGGPASTPPAGPPANSPPVTAPIPGLPLPGLVRGVSAPEVVIDVTADGQVTATARVTAPEAGPLPFEWGTPVRNGAVVTVEIRDRADPGPDLRAQVITEHRHRYDLGTFTDGTYRLEFAYRGRTVLAEEFVVGTGQGVVILPVAAPHFRAAI